MAFMGTALQEFQDITKDPETFLCVEAETESKIKKLLKTNYDFTKSEEPKKIVSAALPELIVRNFDLEQIWQQLELQNNGFLTRSIENVSRLVVAKDKLVFGELRSEMTLDDGIAESDPTQSATSEEEAETNMKDEEEIVFSDDSDSDGIAAKPVKSVKKSVVDDDFFKLDEMEAFLQSEEKKLAQKEPDSGNDSESDSAEDSEEDVDLFENDDDDLENEDTVRGAKNNPKYRDFFGGDADEELPAKKSKRNKLMAELDDDDDESIEGNGEHRISDKRVRFSDDDDDDDGEDGEGIEGNEKSSLEEREERLKRRVEELEENAVGEKPWQLKGEITADGRPKNSLLEEIVEFDLTTRPAPVITEETTVLLQDIIRQRIKDKAFDSVERKQKPIDTPLEYKKKLVLDQEKSKQSLAQIYEKEFVQQQEALDPNSQDKEPEEPELHKEINKLTKSLFAKLDALSNFHFTPRQAAPELKIITNLPAIQIEEVAPVSTSDATLLAPEEVKNKLRGDAVGKSERTSADKNRERRKKKAMQKKHANLVDKREKASAGLGNKYSKAKVKKVLEKVVKEKNVDKMDESAGKKSIKSSTAFFSQLQEEVSSQIKGKAKEKKAKRSERTFEAKKLKM